MASNMDEMKERFALWKEACDAAWYSSDTYEVIENLCDDAMTRVKESGALESASVDCEETIFAHKFQIEILMCRSDARMLLERYGQARIFIEEALDIYERMIPKMAKEDDYEMSFLLAELYRSFSITDFYLEGKKPEPWEAKGVDLLRNMPEEAKENKRFQYLWSVFLTFSAMNEENSNEQNLQMDKEAMETITELVRQEPTNRRYRSSEVGAFRLGAFSKLTQAVGDGDDPIDEKIYQEALDMSAKAISLAQEMCDQTPSAPVVHDRLVRALRASRSVYEAGNKNNKYRDQIQDLTHRAKQTQEVIATLLPNHADNYRYLAELWLDEVEDFLKNKPDEMTTEEHQDKLQFQAEQAIQLAQRAVDLSKTAEYENEDRTTFYSAREYTRCLYWTAKLHWKVTKDLQASLASFRLYEKAFIELVIPDKRVTKTDSYVEDFCRTMELASDVALKANLKDEAVRFLENAVEMGSKRFTGRCCQQICVSHIISLAKLYQEELKWEKARIVLQTGLRIIAPLYQKFPWHFFVGDSFAGVNRELAKVYKNLNQPDKEWRHLQAFIHYSAKLHGIDYSEWSRVTPDNPICTTKSLHADTMPHVEPEVFTIARNFIRKLDLDQLWKRVDNLPSMKTIVINCYFHKAQVYSPFTLYLTSAIPGKDPLEDQARLLEEDHSGTIPEDVRESIRKLHILALKNNVNFQDLCEYALNAATEENNNGYGDEGEDESDDESEESSEESSEDE